MWFRSWGPRVRRAKGGSKIMLIFLRPRGRPGLMRAQLFCAAVLTAVVSNRVASAVTLSAASVDTVLPPGLVWDTFPNASPTLFVKQGSAFVNPAGPLAIDLSTPATYSFETRLNRGTGFAVTKYNFNLYFDGAPEGSIPGIRVLGQIDHHEMAPFTGKSTEVIGDTRITLDSFQLSAPQVIDEVGDFTAAPDGGVDYFGTFQLTVSLVPEPAGAGALAAVAGLCLIRRRR